MPRILNRFTASVLACLLALAGPASRLAAGDVVVIVKDTKGQPVTDAVVSLISLEVSAPSPLKPPAEPVVISQHGEEFDPYVTVVVVGTQVNFPNLDRIRHQVYSLSKTKPFEIPLYGPGTEQSILFDRPGIVALGCNIHDWMSAYLVVLDTPHFMKTAGDGIARLAEPPAGRYRLDVWHPRLTGESRRDIVVAGGDAAAQTISVTLKPDRRIRRAPDGAGGGYK